MCGVRSKHKVSQEGHFIRFMDSFSTFINIHIVCDSTFHLSVVYILMYFALKSMCCALTVKEKAYYCGLPLPDLM